MLEAGKKFRYLVQFLSGQPTSDFTYTLYNQDGDVVVTDSVPISTGQVSYLIEIPAASNSLSKPLFEQMTLEWEYTTATEAVEGNIKYTIHTPIVFPVTPEGVRDLLGVSSEELADSEIDLFSGFMKFRELVGEDLDLTTYQSAGDSDSFKITKSIEALTALDIFPTIQLRLPKKYDSGTSSYERWNNIDWENMHARLSNVANTGLLILNPDIILWPEIQIFVLSDRGPDQITGA